MKARSISLILKTTIAFNMKPASQNAVCSVFFLFGFFIPSLIAQKPEAKNDVNTPLHAIIVDYPVPYEEQTKENVKEVLDKIFNYLDATTPPQMMNKQTGEVVNDINQLDTNTIVKQVIFD